MKLDFKKIYRTIRDKLALPIKRENIEKKPDYSVYQLLEDEWASLTNLETRLKPKPVN